MSPPVTPQEEESVTQKKKVAPVVPTPPIVRDEKFTIREYRLKGAKPNPYDYEQRPAEEPATILADLAARIDTAERCGTWPRITVAGDYSTLTLYGWRKVSP